MEKNVEISLLFSFYGKMLTDRQADTVELYYNEDLSLSEVGAELGISRQGVRDNLKRAEAILYDTEKRLGLAERFLRIKSKLSDIDRIIAEIESSPDSQTLSVNIKKQINSILTIIEEINDDEK
ncbi:MAG: YlxM family DNA-binding protein [Clostridia bacterium]|nr:YlxM family DNA-binding protein [Clostridia bacterium]